MFKEVHEALGCKQCKIFVVGADTMRRDVHYYFMSINIQLMELYGMSESSGPHTVNLIGEHGWRVETCGTTIQGVKVKIIEPNQQGEGEVS